MIKNPTKVAPVLKSAFDADKFDNAIQTCNDRKGNHKDKIHNLAKQLIAFEKQIKEQIQKEHDEIAFLTRTKYACKRIININNKLDISNTYLQNLPIEILQKIQMKNLCDDIKSFKKFNPSRSYESNSRYWFYDRFIPPIKITHNFRRRVIEIHGEEYVYNKGVLMNYLEQNGLKGYKSWTFKKLYDTCYSF